MSRISAEEAGGSNVTAFLDMIAHSEIGDTLLAASDDGYNVLVGSKSDDPHLFTSYADHPRVLVHLTDVLSSTAAGRYQLLARYFDAYKRILSLPDFSPESQDRIAIQQIKESHGLEPLAVGNFDEAVNRCAHIWASLPGAGYSQHENQIDDLRLAYLKAGGTVA